MTYIKIVYTILLTSFTIMLSGQAAPVGWASANGGTTGGFGGEVVMPTTRNEFVAYCASSDPLIIAIRDTIDLILYERVSVNADKTIYGITTNAMLRYGGLEVNGSNVIIRNLIIGETYDGDWDGKTHSTDAITVQNSNVWVDHCWLKSSADGLLDVRSANATRIGDYVTVSYTRFSDHNKVSLIGSSDDSTQDRDHLKVTFHHCWWDGTIEKGLNQRLPRVRYGDVHLYNNFFENIDSYCTLARIESDVVVEYNYYRNANNPHGIEDYGLGMKDPTLVARGNIYEYSNGNKKADGIGWEPSEFYEYQIDSTISIPALVMNEAGPFNPSGNHNPVAEDDVVFLEEGQRTFNFDPLENDTDPDGDNLRLGAIINTPTGAVQILNDMIRYVGISNPTQFDTILYELVDTKGGLAIGQLVVQFEGISTSIEEVQPENIIIFPNPAKNSINLQLDNLTSNVFSVSLIDMSGKIYFQKNNLTSHDNSLKINTQNIPGGIYMISLKTEKGIFSKKIIITR